MTAGTSQTFRELRCEIALTAAAGTDPARVDRLLTSAEKSCVIADTLRRGVPVRTSSSVAGVT